MKKILPFVFGGVMGFIISLYFSVYFIYSGRLFETILVVIITLIVSGFLHILLHELGHVLGGWLTGYQLSVFRMLYLTLYRGKSGWQTKVDKQSITRGILGQALMVPTKKNVPVIPYFLGGITVNILLGITLLAVARTLYQPLWNNILIVAGYVGIFFGGMNLMPIDPTDGYHLKEILRTPSYKEQLRQVLITYKQLMQGVPMHEIVTHIDLNDKIALSQSNQTSLMILKILNAIDQHEFNQAYALSQQLWSVFDQLFNGYKEEVYALHLLAFLLADNDSLEMIQNFKQHPYFEKVITSDKPEHATVQSLYAAEVDGNYSRAMTRLSIARERLDLIETKIEQAVEERLLVYLEYVYRR